MLATDSVPAAQVDVPIVFTQVPPTTNASTPKGLIPGPRRSPSFEHARLALFLPSGQTRLLVPDFAASCDPDISFDAQRILFAGKKESHSPWRIWEIGVDGRGLRPVSHHSIHARTPIYVSTLFTLDSPQPWLTTVFVGFPISTETTAPLPANLFNLKLDGTELRRLTFTPHNSFDPFQMWDGRILFSSERYPLDPNNLPPRLSLFAIHVEGADVEFYGGELGPPQQHMACATPSGQVVFVESNPDAPDGAGALACLDERRPHVTYQSLTRPGDDLFLYPYPLTNRLLLVSRRPAIGPHTAGLFTFDLDSRRAEPLFDTPDYHELQPKPVQPRPTPDGHSTVVNTTLTSGTLYGLNCYDTNPSLASNLKPGAVKRIRIVEQLLPAPQLSSTPGHQLTPRRIVGEAPVEPDGSFNVEIPADTPILLQPLNEHGAALATCGWLWVKPKETRGCIGCHEDPERIPENQFVLALRRPSNRLTLPPPERRTLGFREDIAPILKQYCAATDCHGNPKALLHFPLDTQPLTESSLEQISAALLHPPNNHNPYIFPGRARSSPLISQLIPSNRPLVPAATPNTPEPSNKNHHLMPTPNRQPILPQEQLLTLIQWIDIGAPYHRVQPGSTKIQPNGSQ